MISLIWNLKSNTNESNIKQKKQTHRQRVKTRRNAKSKGSGGSKGLTFTNYCT